MYDKEICDNNWSQKIKKLINELDLDQHWLHNRAIPLDTVKTKIRDQFIADWRHQCSTKDKLRTYVTFQDSVEVAPHLNSNLPKYERSLISQLRLGVLPLRIETGRYVNLPAQDRLCQICAQNKVEDEAHFLFECDTYTAYRDELEIATNSNFANMSTSDKFRVVFNHPYSLGRFMKSAFQKRKGLLYK